MQIYLPIAEMAVPAEMILLVSTVVGFLSGVFGVGGGFLTTPFLIFMGVPPAVAVGTQANQLVASSMAGVFGHLKRGNVDLKMGAVMLLGGALGTVVGVFIFKMLEYLGQIDFFIAISYVVLLGSIGTLMLIESASAVLKKKSFKSEFNSFKLSKAISALPYKMRFPRSKLYISVLVPGGIGFVGGLLATVMGIGGGFLLVPAMIYMLGMPTLLAAGTSLFQMIFTASFATLIHAVANNTVDIVLGVVLIIGGVIGAQIGVTMARHVHGVQARVILAILVLVVAIQLATQLFIRPEEIYSTVLW